MTTDEKAQEENGKKKRVLIVDDETDITNSFSLALEDSGLFEVETYNDPILAISNFKPNYYDMLLADLRMPHMSGLELYGEIEKRDNKIKVCFISAFDVDYKALRKQFQSLEIERIISKPVLRKPIEIDKLIDRIQIELLK